MKNFNLFTLVIAVSLVFTSCSTEESINLDNPNAGLLKSYTVNRDASGAYSLGYNLKDNATVDNVKDTKTNTNQIYLYSSDYQSTLKSSDVSLENGALNIEINDTKSNKRSKITVLDNDIKMNRTSNERLESYGITGNDDGTYNLDFKVIEGVSVEYIYDGDRNVYEVHLNESSSATQSSFLQTFTKEDGIALNIEFVNNIINTTSRSYDPNRPVVIIQ